MPAFSLPTVHTSTIILSATGIRVDTSPHCTLLLHLVPPLEFTITSSTAPPASALAHRLLNLAEFMEHEESLLPMENWALADRAQSPFTARAGEFFAETFLAAIEALISINSQPQLHNAARGALLVVGEQYNVRHDERHKRPSGYLRTPSKLQEPPELASSNRRGMWGHSTALDRHNAY
ncbi:hypothetical protein V8D89_012659 [Ganoderma adspersum]